MSKEMFAFGTLGKGRYKIQVVEKAICLRVARKAVQVMGYADAFEQATGRRFTGTGADRELLPPSVACRVDAALCNAMRRHQRAWRKSPVVNVALDRPEAENLILNQGLDYLAGHTAHWGSIGTYCVLGSGTTAPAYTDTGLVAEIRRTSNTLSSGTFVTDDVPTRSRTLQRTYDFPAETSGQNYAELGLSHSETATNNLSTRALIDGGTVAVATGQQARVVYKVIITLGANAVMTPTSSTGWTAGLQGTSAHCNLTNALPTLTDSGQSFSTRLSLSTGSTIPTFGTDFSRGTSSDSTSGALVAYTTGSYKRVRTSTWNLSDGIGTWRSLTLQTYSESWCFVFDNAQTKDDEHTLIITWSMSYGRA